MDKDKVGKNFHARDETEFQKTLKKVPASSGQASSENMKARLSNSTFCQKIGASNVMKNMNETVTNCTACKEVETPTDKR